MTSDYKRLAPRQYAQLQATETPEAKYWRRFGRPNVTVQPAAVTSVDFSATPPHDFALSCSTHVAIHEGRGGQLLRTIGRFADVACGARFRGDGKLVATGDKSGAVKAIEVQSKTILRSFSGHTAAVHGVGWACDNLRIGSASDDGSLRVWDLPTASAAELRQGHTDYVRALAPSPVDPTAWTTGSYDRTVRLWDTRQAAPALILRHAAPVEAILYLPGGTLLAGAGGNELRVWDLMAGGRQLHSAVNHQKTITCLALDATRSRLLTGALDCHVKIYSLQSYTVTHGLRYPAPLLSLALAPDNGLLVAGTADNALTVRRREAPAVDDDDLVAAGIGRPSKSGSGPAGPPRPGSLRYFNRGRTAAPGEDDVIVASSRRKTLKPYDKALRTFRYHDALDVALATKSPAIVVTVMDELASRRGLGIALAGRDEAGLEPLLSFLARHIARPRYAPQLLDVSTAVLDLYGGVVGQSEAFDALLARLARQVRAEAECQKDLRRLLGTLDAVVGAATVATAAGATDAAAAAVAAAAAAHEVGADADDGGTSGGGGSKEE